METISSRLLNWMFIALFAGAIVFGYHFWRDWVTQQALTQFNQKQLEYAQKANEVFAKEKAELEETVKTLSSQLAQTYTDLDAKTKEIQDFLDSPPVIEQEKRNGLSSDTLRETVKKLGGQK